MDTAALEALAGRRKIKVKADWTPPTSESFALPSPPALPRGVLAIDQSLNGCAAVLLGAARIDGRAVIEVNMVRKFNTGISTGVGGYEESLQRGEELYLQLAEWIAQIKLFSAAPIQVVHEQPPIGGGRIVRPESSLLAAFAVRRAANVNDYPVMKMAAPQSHKFFTCGDRKADKKKHHAALKILAAELGITGMELITNEDLRDALSIGLFHMSLAYRPE